MTWTMSLVCEELLPVMVDVDGRVLPTDECPAHGGQTDTLQGE